MNHLQTKVRSFCRDNNLESPLEHSVLDLISETGELAKEVLLMTDYGRRNLEYREEVSGELGDLFYSLITVANILDVDLDEALDSALGKYSRRLESGSAGSGS